MPSFCEQLQARVDAVDSLICVGLDPHIKVFGHTAPVARFFLFLLPVLSTPQNVFMHATVSNLNLGVMAGAIRSYALSCVRVLQRVD
jgi:hypothetical protein